MKFITNIVWLLATLVTLYLEFLVTKSHFPPVIKWGWSVVIGIIYLGISLLCVVFSQSRDES
ncbi:MAG: hypothetical protein HY399_01755 [Elusimicrobia bacterium]|nr:hypothetical protein [Elusimicrobiota bacterium]